MSLMISQLSKAFKDNTVLDKISLSIETGQTLVLFGPSGAGKTVLLRLIAGVIEPDEGTISIGGKNLEGIEPEERGVGMAFQNFALFPHMDAYQNISSPLTARNVTGKSLDQSVRRWASLLKIDHVLDHKPRELSNGQKQRTSLARALAGEPEILLLDDPLRNVDAKLRFEMRLELPKLLRQQNATVIYVTQDYKEAMALGDHIAVMNNRGIQQYGTPEDIYLRPDNIDTARLFGDPAINLLDVTLAKHKSGVSVEISGQQILIDPGFHKHVGEECILGIRPEALSYASKSKSGAFPVTIEAQTPLNEKTVDLMVTKRGRELMLSRPSESSGPNLKSPYTFMDESSVLLFDKCTGNRIMPEPQSTEEKQRI